MPNPTLNLKVPRRLQIPQSKINELANFLKNARKIAVLTHTSIDADAFGSAMATTLAIYNNYNLPIRFFTEDQVDKRWLRLIPPRLKPQVYTQVDSIPTALADYKPSHLLIVDVSYLERLTAPKYTNEFKNYILRQVKATTVLDHHPATTDYANLEIIYPYSSTAELLYILFSHLSLELQKPEAQLLLLGLLGDTGRLRWTKHDHTFTIIQRLLNLGADWNKVYSLVTPVFNAKTYDILLKILPNLVIGKHFAYIIIPQKLYTQLTGPAGNAIKQFLKEEIMANIPVPVRAIITYQPNGKVAVSLGSRSSQYQVNQLAQQYGGGGHAFAAGFKIEKSKFKLQEFLNTLRVWTTNLSQKNK